MLDLIQSQTKKIMFNCCEKYAAKKGLSTENVQLILGLNTEGNTYTMCVNYAPKEEYDIMQVLGVKIDFLGYSRMAPPFIIKALVRFSTQYKIEIGKIRVMCVPFEYHDGKKNRRDVRLALFNGVDYVHTSYKEEGKDEEIEGLSFTDLFNEQDIELPTI